MFSLQLFRLSLQRCSRLTSNLDFLWSLEPVSSCCHDHLKMCSFYFCWCAHRFIIYKSCQNDKHTADKSKVLWIIQHFSLYSLRFWTLYWVFEILIIHFVTFMVVLLLNWNQVLPHAFSRFSGSIPADRIQEPCSPGHIFYACRKWYHT